MIPLILTWDDFDNIPDIANFLKDNTLPLTDDTEDMLTQAAKVSDKTFLNEILSLISESSDEDDFYGIVAATMTFVSFWTLK